jgi:hypothetical protein
LENVGNSSWLTAHRLLAVTPRPPGVVLIFLLLLAGGWLIALLGLFQSTPPPPRGDEFYLFRLLSMEAAEALFQIESTRPTPASTLINAIFWLAMVWLPAGLLLAVFRRQMDSWLVGHIAGHVLVYGSGPVLLSIMAGKRSGNVPSVALLQEGSQALRKKLDEIKLPWRSEHNTREVLSRSLVTPGAAIFAGDEDDTANIHLVDLITSLLARIKPAKGLSLMVRITDGQLRRQLSDRYMARPELRQLRLVVYSDHDLRSRLAARNWPAFHFCHADSPEQAHLLVVGEGYPAESMLVQLLKSSHYPAGMSVRFSWVAPEASREETIFTSRYPELARHHDVEFFSLDSGNYSDWARWLTKQSEQGAMPTAFYLASANGAQQMNWALALEDAYRIIERFIPPVILLNAGALAEQSRSENGFAGSPMFRAVPDVNRVEQGNLVSQVQLDQIARGIHDGYLEESLAGGAKLGDWPSLVAWEDLPEMMKDENRDQADHNLLKLRLMGLSLSHGSAAIPDIDTELLEQVSKVEHDRWLASRRSRGWAHAEVRDDAERKHPDMISWEELSETARKKDRNMVRQFPGLMKSMNIQVKPLMFILAEAVERTSHQDLASMIEGAAGSVSEAMSAHHCVLVGSPSNPATQATYRALLELGQFEFLAVLETPWPGTEPPGSKPANAVPQRSILDRPFGIIAGADVSDARALANAIPVLQQKWMLLKLEPNAKLQARFVTCHKREATRDGRLFLELQETAC